MNITAKDAIAIVALCLAVGLLAPYVMRNEVPPDVILLISAPTIAGVMAYYFGAHNGNITGLAASAVQVSNMAAQLAAQAIEKRAATPPAVAVVTAPIAPIANPTPGGSSSGT